MINLTSLGIIFLLIVGFLVLIYNLGKSAREKQLIKDNNDLRKEYDKVKNNINSSNDLSDKLQKGNY